MNGTFHVHPIDDLIDHELTDDCPCGPTMQPVEHDDGSVACVLVHHSLDGREADESM